MKSSDNLIFETRAVEYDNGFEKHPALFEKELKLIRKVIPPNGLGIEIGMGTGRFSKALNIKIGVEPYWPMAQSAICREIIALNAKAEALPLFNQSLDYKNANFHTVMEITDLMAQAAFGAFKYWQTLIGDIEKDQQPIAGYGAL